MTVRGCGNNRRASRRHSRTLRPHRRLRRVRTSFAGERQGGMQTGRIMLGVGVNSDAGVVEDALHFKAERKDNVLERYRQRLAAQQQGGWESSGPNANAQGGGIRAGLAGAWFAAAATGTSRGALFNRSRPWLLRIHRQRPPRPHRRRRSRRPGWPASTSSCPSRDGCTVSSPPAGKPKSPPGLFQAKPWTGSFGWLLPWGRSWWYYSSSVWSVAQDASAGNRPDHRALDLPGDVVNRDWRLPRAGIGAGWGRAGVGNPPRVERRRLKSSP